MYTHEVTTYKISKDDMVMIKLPISNPPKIKPRVLCERLLIFGLCDYCRSHIIFDWHKFKKVCAGGCESYKKS